MSSFAKKDGLKYHLEDRWCNGNQHVSVNTHEPTREFPVHKEQLIENYCELELLMNKRWHPNATLGAALAGNGLLTDHGVSHIQAVMQHAYEIIGSNVCALNGYEIYILLLAIHFHDLGNIYGREEHEQKIDEVIEEIGEKLPLDNVEKEFVTAIAKAHGGYNNEDKDTIKYISVDDTCNGVQVRAKMLAALLRFSDEISDDFSRSSYDGVVIPPENEIYHAYSKALEPVSIQGETVKFHFRIPHTLTQKKLGKGNEKVYLYDEIRDRLAKCMRELEYCRKYANGHIRITTLNIIIDIKDAQKPSKTKHKSTFRLELLGYPSESLVKLEDFLAGNSCSVSHSESSTRPFKSGLELQKAMCNNGGAT